jgi:hypothetical protein
MTVTRLYVRLITRRDADPADALTSLTEVSQRVTGAAPEVIRREPYDKLGLYAESVWSRVDAPIRSLLELYQSLTAVSPKGWWEDQPDRNETVREAIWEDRRADAPLFDDAIRWAHVTVVEEDA